MRSQSNDLFQLRDTIEKMTKFNQIAILRILNDSDDVIINENRNGIHINLTELSEDVIKKLQEYKIIFFPFFDCRFLRPLTSGTFKYMTPLISQPV